MNDMNVCGNHEALIGYLYDECDPAQRDAVAAHVASCALCTEEIQVLRDTRAHLGAWSPPALPLGFQLTRTESETFAGRDSRTAQRDSWWSRPLPAWAQAAAAVAIFAAGMGANGLRSRPDDAPAPVVARAPAPAPAPVVATPPVDGMAVTRDEFLRLEQRLRSIERADVQLASSAGQQVDQDELFARLNALEQRNVENDRQMIGLISTVSRLAREAENQRESIRAVNQMRADVQDLNYVVRTAVVPSLTVRTGLTNGR
jgi:hypothetical protein